MKTTINIPNSLPKLDLNITNRCNFRCIHCCFNSGETMLKEFSLHKISETLHNFKKLGGQRIDITGGEPLIRKDLPAIIKLGEKLNLKMELVTNGSLLTKTRLIQFKQLGLNNIAISLDGSNYRTYKKIRPVAKKIYDAIINNIQEAIKLGFYTKINTVVFNSNLEDITKITNLCIDWGIKEYGLYYFTPVGRGQTSPTEIVNPLKWLKIIQSEIYPLKDKIKLSIETPLLKNSCRHQTSGACYLKNPWHLQILPDGNVYPCAIMAFYNKPCGNLYHQTLSEIWHDQKLWDGSYYRQNVIPLFEKFGGCINFGQSFKKLISYHEFKFACLMCKFTDSDLYEK